MVMSLTLAKAAWTVILFAAVLAVKAIATGIHAS